GNHRRAYVRRKYDVHNDGTSYHGTILQESGISRKRKKRFPHKKTVFGHDHFCRILSMKTAARFF
ncbi:MAG: hypothetical protein LBO04_07365, partial [Spirochaetaceae bacterium]|nr:hypothetical protein [Spirochaetaceae bacterium]